MLGILTLSLSLSHIKLLFCIRISPSQLQRSIDMSFKCQVCDKKFIAKSSLKAHLTTHERVRQKLPCMVCGKTYTTAFNLKTHYESQHPERNMRTNDLSERIPVERKVHEPNMPKCNLCGKVFRRKQNLKDHILDVHVGARKIRCEPCKNDGKEKVFGRYSDLQRHIKKFHLNTTATKVNEPRIGFDNDFSCDEEVNLSNEIDVADTAGSNHNRLSLTPIDVKDVAFSTLNSCENSQIQASTSAAAVSKTILPNEIFQSSKIRLVDKESEVDDLVTEINQCAEFPDHMDQETMSRNEELCYNDGSLVAEQSMGSNFLKFGSKCDNKVISNTTKNTNDKRSQNKLPSPCVVQSFDFKKISSNIYLDSVKPFQPVDSPKCDCKPAGECGDDCLNRLVFTECDPETCPCAEKCQYTKIQMQITAPVECFKTRNKGWGVKTNHLIKEGTFILEYTGEVVYLSEFKERMATIYKNDMNHYCLQLEADLVIDASRMGSDCRFVNHSCDPNCKMDKWLVNGKPRMALFPMRDIQPGEELTFDYNFSLFNSQKGQTCKCESQN